MRLKGIAAALPLLLAATCAFAGGDKNRTLYEYRWYTLDNIKAFTKHYYPKDMSWVFPPTRRYILDGEGTHSAQLAPVALADQDKRNSKKDLFWKKPGQPIDLDREIDKRCMQNIKAALIFLGGRTTGPGPIKSPPYEVVGIQSHVLAQAPLELYHSRKRQIISKTPPTPGALLCAIYQTPVRERIRYETIVVFTAKAAYGSGKW